MTRTHLILICLVLGVLAGMAIRWADLPSLTAAANTAILGGQLWVRALQMTLVPLIFAMLTHSVATAVATGRGGRMIGTTLAVFLAVMVVTVAICTVLTEVVLHIWPIPPNALAGLMDNSAAQALPSLATQLLAIIPDNPVAAAAQGQIFPLVIFGLAFGGAIARLPRKEGGAQPVVIEVLANISQAMMKIVDWVLVAAPFGIFLLAMGLGLSSGLGIAQVLVTFVALCFATSLLMVVLCYVAVLIARAYPLGKFASAILPAQAMAAGSCSSMATTPVMLEVAIDKLKLPKEVVGLVIPLAVSVFRLGTVAHAVAAVLIAAHAVGIEPTPLQLVLAGLAVILGSISGAGLPGAAVVYAIYGPGIQLLGAPMAIMPLYVAVIALPDPVITMTSVTGNLTVTTLVNRLLGRGKTAPDDAA
ncbi:hypothetical protein ABAC460_14165 [Asticcacaulis sp. AC460]|uniref:dicarboxylate/amino acid:cation symporter n=1 Tax=Asticcacaulis sp. AC460 TaxID=1282360 RepID=UPI0003C3CA13|nr:cation:dicarboxylase symporter family transporter [Asticcacaulis sp. AC460]ESQ88922.1 hypothetical protein ABAC460_14165 [Asticcacaulis sp. AC460]